MSSSSEKPLVAIFVDEVLSYYLLLASRLARVPTLKKGASRHVLSKKASRPHEAAGKPFKGHRLPFKTQEQSKGEPKIKTNGSNHTATLLEGIASRI